MNTLRVVSVLVGLSAVVAARGEAGPDDSQVKSALGKAEVTMSQAIEIATKEVKGGKPYTAALKMEGGKAVYEVKVMGDEGWAAIAIDAVGGKVLKVEKAEAAKTPVQQWSFDKDLAGALPPGWVIKQNNPTKELAKWAVAPDPEAPSKPHVLSVKTDNGNQTFNLAIVEKTVYKDLDLSVKVKGCTGKEDQGGGLIWRCKDENNYYTCRINPLEPNYRVYKVVDGKRQQILSAKVETLTAKWYTLRVVMQGEHIVCFLDGVKVLDAMDTTFKDAGMIGLWTKADASSSFDDLTVRAVGTKTQRKEKGE